MYSVLGNKEEAIKWLEKVDNDALLYSEQWYIDYVIGESHSFI